MPSLIRQSLVLSFSRLANQAIVLLSPMLLVRLLPVVEYGRYREFLLYAGMIAPLVTFGIRHSLIYFLPRYPEKEPIWLTQTSLFIFATSSLAIVFLALGADLIRVHTSSDFVTALQVYILFYINMDFLESYWLGKKRADLVLYTSAIRLVGRMTVVVVCAWITREAQWIIVGLVAFEAGRCSLVLLYGTSRAWFTRAMTWSSLRLQLSYVLPMGTGAVIEVFGRNIGTLLISATMGPEALAFYATGAFATQIVNVLRGAIADVVFPEIVGLRHAVPRDALPLWKRATIWYCVLLFPVAGLFAVYAEPVVTVLFTSEYKPAAPIFSAFAVVLLLDCFDFHLPLRVQNANRHFMTGSALAFAVNLGLLYPLHSAFGMVGPAIALIASRLAFTVYLGFRAMQVYEVDAREIVEWKAVGKVLFAVIACIPLLVLGNAVFDHPLARVVLAGGIYLIAYCVLIRALGVWDCLATMRRFLGLTHGD